MRAIAARDPDALEQLYDRYAPLAMAVCLRVLRDFGRAEETTIDVFAELWRKPDRYDPTRGGVRGFILLLARSRSIDRLRSVRTEPSNRPLHGVTGTADQAAPRPAEAVIEQERANLVRAAVDALEPQHREALEAAFFEGLSHTEVADKLHRPLGTVKSHIRQALSKLRDALAGSLDDDLPHPTDPTDPSDHRQPRRPRD